MAKPGSALHMGNALFTPCYERGPGLGASVEVRALVLPSGHYAQASGSGLYRVQASGKRRSGELSFEASSGFRGQDCALSKRAGCKFFSLTETPEDYTIIVDEEGFLELPSSEHLSVADATWLALNVVSGGGSFSSSQPIGVTKIAKSVIAPLADQNISVFMLSTYQTDFILVRERDLPFVTHTLSSEFTILRVVNGETVAAENLGITNGFAKPKMVQRPVIHPLSSPSNRFCVTSLDPDTLPAVATLLMDVMFYSNGVKDPLAAGEDCGHIRFFSFSLIEGYISLVMDAQTQQRFPSNLLFTSASGELWKMVRIGGQPLGFDECGIVAQISEPLAAADIPAYYISTFKFDHALIPEENISGVISALKVSHAEKH
ncbi:PREDICTED: GATS-like protein 2 [Dipodomys ordii]|uniref:GATS-like protein 2 n=1 Tax=Dipodomys ordii TaxID=10020 RepID=A0A1S3GIU4_DIPOR|nr:PREDICTED: GATS-like protein 2 [Dipodomys ordii]